MLVLLLLLASADAARADGGSLRDEGAPPPSAREIYQRFLDNRFSATITFLRIVSSDPRGNRQEADLYVRWKDYRDVDDAAGDVVSKTYVRFLYPNDLWRLTYLLIGRRGRAHDQFVYVPQIGRSRRMETRGVGLLGTDYTVDDLVFQTIDDAAYQRLPDDEVAGRKTYVIAVRTFPSLDTEYPRAVFYIDQERYVPLRAIFEDASGRLAREMVANVETLVEMDGVWLVREATMTDLRDDTSSTLLVQELYANPDLPEHRFSAFELQRRRR
jgi:hypothetical protein